VDLNFIIGLVSRWIHILAAITAVGGTIFMRMALLPSVSELADDARKQLHAAVRGRWAKFVMGSIAFLIISGLYNIYVIETQKKIPAGDSGLYHALFGIKFLLAFGIFFIASALVGRSPAFERIRQKARFWLTLNMTLAILVVCLSGVLRALRDKPPAPASTAPAAVQGPGWLIVLAAAPRAPEVDFQLQ
jgi:uncharacterized membrane protein